jgi:hypothetical protein
MAWEPWPKVEARHLARYVTPDAVRVSHLVEGRDDLVHKPDGRRLLLRALYEALTARHISYAPEKYHPDEELQQIRTPAEILEAPGEGTCLDLSVLVCGLCLGFDLLPLLIVIKGHALVAVSLERGLREWMDFGRREIEQFDRGLLEDPEPLRGLIDQRSYLALECTGFAHSERLHGAQPEEQDRERGFLTFTQAGEVARKQLDVAARPFRFALDIASLHYRWGVAPFPAVQLEERAQRLVEIAEKYTILAAPQTATFKTVRLKERLNRLLDRHALFGGRERHLCALDAFVTDRSSGYAFVAAESGFGKTALLANWVRKLEERNEKVAYHFISRLDDLAGEDFMLRSLCQQLVALHGLGGELPASVVELRSLYPQLLGVSPGDGRRVIVVLDGLDEAQEVWTVGPDLFPSSLPAGVFLVFSAPVTGQDWLAELELTPDQVFLETLETLGTGEIAQLMQVAGGTAAERAADPGFVEAVWQCSSGDPFFLRYLVEDIREKPILTISELQAQPKGLVKYLDGWWKEVSASVGEQPVRELLGYLLVAHGRMSRDDLTNISAEDALDGFVFERTLEEVRRFVVGNDDEGYALCHPRFQDYVSSNRIKASDQKPYRDRVLNYCAAWEEHRSPYALNHFAEHLREAGQHEKLFRMLEAENWYAARTASDSTGTAFINDLSQGRSAAEAIDGKAIQDGQPAPLLGREVRIALSVATLHGFSGHIPVRLLTALVKQDLWSVERALSVARRNPDPAGRTDALLALVALNEVERAAILREALLPVLEMDPIELQRLDVLRRLLPTLPEPLVDLALEAADKIEDPQTRAAELAVLVPFLPAARQSQVAQTALNLLEKSEWDGGRMIFWEQVEGWPEPLGGEALARALKHIQARPEGDEWRARLLPGLAGRVSGPRREELLREALAATLAIREDDPRQTQPGYVRQIQVKAHAFKYLVPELTGALLREALGAAESIQAIPDRSMVLAKFVPALAREGNIAESLRVAEAVVGDERLGALVEMAPFLTGTSDIEAALRLVPDEEGAPQGWPLAALSIRLAELGNPETALAKARAIGSPARRLATLAGIAAKMPILPSKELIQEVLDATHLSAVQRSLASGFEVSEESLLALALRLAKGGRVNEALAAVRAFKKAGTGGGAGPRAEALTLLAEHLPEPAKSQTLREALAAAQVVGDGRTRVMIIAELVQQAPSLATNDIQTILDAALSAVSLIGEEHDQCKALGRLAAFLTPPLLEQALTAARGFDEPETRILAMVQIAPHLSAPLKDQVLEEAMDLAETVEWHEENAGALIELVAQLPQSRQRETLRWAITNDWVWLLADLTPRLPEPLQREAIEGLRALEDPFDRVWGLSRVAQQLPDELRPETLTAIQNLPEDYRARFLFELAPWLPDSALEEAVNLAQQLTDDNHWPEALPTLLPRWAESGHAQEALEVLEQMDWSPANFVGLQRSRRAQILAAIVPKLSESERESALEDALPNIRNLQSKSMFACAAADLAQHLAEPMRMQLIEEAFHATLDNQRWRERASALQALAPHLPQSLLADAAAAASQLPATRYLVNKNARAEALAALAIQLAKLPPILLYPIWRETLSRLSRSSRPDLLWDLKALLPILTGLGCANAPLAMAQAITAVAQRWP